MKGDIFNDFVHELNNSIGIISFLLDEIREKNADNKDYLEAIDHLASLEKTVKHYSHLNSLEKN